MFFSRKKATVDIDAALQAALPTSAIIEEIKQKIETAGRISDAAERYLALTTIESEVQAQKKNVQNKIEEVAVVALSSLLPRETKSLLALKYSSLFSICTGGVMVLFFPVPIFAVLPLMAGAMGYVIGVGYAGSEREMQRDRLHSQVLSKGEGDCHILFSDVLKDMADRKNFILREELPALAESRHFNMLYEDHPAVQDAFAKAATRAAARDSVLPPAHTFKLDKPFRP